MEALLIRGFVLALALSGFGASTVSRNTTTSNGAMVTADTTPPSCPYNDPNFCGMD
jgi:hypothetical protein